MIEHEKKILLTEAEYMCILNGEYNFSDEKIHINHYYDTDDLKYNALGITCRIRENGKEYVATIKNHSGLETSNERAEYVKNERDTSLFDGMNVKCFGSMRTKRREAVPLKGVKLVLDRNLFLDVFDYELEIEYEAEYDKMATCLLESISDDMFYNGLTKHREEILLRANASPNKSQRFFRRFSELKFDRTSVSCNHHTHKFGSFAHAQINLQSGNLKVELEGINFNGIAPVLTAGFIYGSDSENDTANYKIEHLKGLFGCPQKPTYQNWSFSLMQSMTAKEIAGRDAVYDGYIFTNDIGEKSYFIPDSDSNLENKSFEKYIDADDKSRIYDANARKLFINGTVYWFDRRGRLCKFFDNNKNYVTITYNGNRIVYTSDNNGNEIFINYNLFGQIKTITTSDGHRAIYSYNSSSGMLNSIIYSDGSRISFKYTNNKICCIELLDSRKKGVYKVEYSYKENKVRKAEVFFFDESGECARCSISKYIYNEPDKKTIVYNTEIAYLDAKKRVISKSKSVYNFNKDGKVLSCYVHPYESKKHRKRNT